jgi:hypothetical protein
MLKRIYIPVVLLALLGSARASAQDDRKEWTDHFSPYGFFRTLGIFDTRDSKAGSEDLFYYLPMDKTTNRQGKDIYSNPSFKMYAITTRLGLNVNGYRHGRMQVGGKLEGDFYLMNGSTASFRLRQAYADLSWDKLGYMENTLTLRVGQAWHPMAADMPYCVNIETGSPFNPFNRSPQIILNANMSKAWDLTGGILYPMQFLPTGPAGPSENYVKYSLVPEIYLGASYSCRWLTAKAGVDVLSLRPRWRTTTTDNVNYDVGTKVSDRLFTYNPFIYLEGRAGSFRINAKSVFANGGDHLRLMSGYALCDDSDIYNYKYTPLRSSVSFVSFSYGTKWQIMCMGGYMKALGTWEELPVDSNGHSSANSIYYFANGFKNINQMLRATPTIAFNVGNLTIAAEYDYTMVQYGDIDALDSHGLASSNLHWILNHRAMMVFKVSF